MGFTVYEGSDLLCAGDLVLFDAIPSPSKIIGLHLRSGKSVDVTGKKFENANNSLNERNNYLLNKLVRPIYENISFVCEYTERDTLRALGGEELLRLMLGQHERYAPINEEGIKFHSQLLR
jgi:hypothetical protein